MGLGGPCAYLSSMGRQVTGDPYLFWRWRVAHWQEKVYSLSQFYRPDRTGAIEKFAPGDVIQLYLEKTGRSWNVNDWVDGSVYGIYDRYGKPIHPIEASWREREKDCWVGLWFGGVMEAVCGACIWLLVRHPRWIARMNRWSESVPERRTIEFGRRKRK